MVRLWNSSFCRFSGGLLEGFRPESISIISAEGLELNKGGGGKDFVCKGKHGSNAADCLLSHCISLRKRGASVCGTSVGFLGLIANM